MLTRLGGIGTDAAPRLLQLADEGDSMSTIGAA